MNTAVTLMLVGYPAVLGPYISYNNRTITKKPTSSFIISSKSTHLLKYSISFRQIVIARFFVQQIKSLQMCE